MKKLAIILLLLAVHLLAFPQITFEKILGGPGWDYGRSVVQSPDGGYVICGYTGSYGAGESDIYLIKLDENGNELWYKTIGGGNYDRAYSIQFTNDNGYIICGYTSSFGNGGSDVYLIKVDENGNTMWSNTFGGEFGESGNCVIQTNDLGYIICGYKYAELLSDQDFYVIRVGQDGNLIWSKTFDIALVDIAGSVIQTADDGFLVVGTVGNTHGPYSAYAIKLDESGNSLWDGTYDGSEDPFSCSVVQPGNDGYYILGTTDDFGLGATDFYLQKIDGNGNALWAMAYGGEGYDSGSSICETNDNGLLLCGHTSSFGAGGNDGLFIKTDLDGNILWTNFYGGVFNEVLFDVRQASDNGFFACGYFLETGSGQNSDVYVVKTDENGQVMSVPPIQMKNPHCSIFPNPCSGRLNIKMDEDLHSIQIMDMNGKIVLHKIFDFIQTTEERINLAFLTSGIYYVKINTKNVEFVEKLILVPQNTQRHQ